MLVRKLGSSGIEVSAVGFGAWAIGGWMWGGTDEAQAVEAIHAALDHGINLIDTAPSYGYGRSEEIVGQAIRGRRDQVVLATKCGIIWDRQEGEFSAHANQFGVTKQPSEKKLYRCLRPESIRRELERSLTRLGTTHIDLYQTHWQDSTTPIAETIGELLRLKEQGKIRAIGVSNVSLPQLKTYGSINSDQERYSLLDRDIESNGILAHCRHHAIAMLAYSPLVHGLLTGKLRADRPYGPGDLRADNSRFTPESVEKINALLEKIKPVAKRHQATVAQVVIAWTLAQPGITSALCGARNPRQAVENAEAGRIELSPGELDTIGKTVRFF